ncbi:MAG: holo-ACP synthase [Alphaproteobacteria bacterium]|nr:holo-ACP synthase [Alphaproteobacteria bacterium]
MILGIGSDLIDITRIDKILARHGDRFIGRIFTETEKAKAARRGSPAATFAKRFAAKEACSKALGTGINKGVYFRDMGVVNLPSGQPTLQLEGGAKARLAVMVPAGMRPVIHLTMTDDYPLAQAFVVIEAVPC